MERKLASVRMITDIRPIEGADAIECAVVDGWTVVVKKDEFQVGSRVVYFEIDSWIPYEMAPFLSKGKEPREFNGVKGERLRTVKLRGQLSQGLVIPVPIGFVDACVGDDLTSTLGIQKWEAPLPACLSGQAEGMFPSSFTKSDQERAQNLVREIFIDHDDEMYEVTLKLDGSSFSIYNKGDGQVGVCSRNLELKVNEENADNSFIRTARETGLLDVMSRPEYQDFMVQAELMGPGIQGNREGLKGFELFVFDVQKKGHVKLSPGDRAAFFHRLVELGANIKHCPVVQNMVKLIDLRIDGIDDLKKWADQPSMNNHIAEGFVFKSYDSDFTFKIINDRFLLGEK